MMTTTINNHDSSKRYRVEYRYGTVRKTLLVPAGAVMPIKHSHENLPMGNVNVTLKCEGDTIAEESFEINTNSFTYGGSHIVFTNFIKV